MVAKPISPIISALLAGALALLLSSCYETKQEFTINPDGSGKVRHECSFQSVRINNEDDTSPEALKAAIAKIIADSKGVDAWTDVSFKRLDDGRMWFRGTAYFKKLADLQIPNQSMLELAWKNLGGGRAELGLGYQKSEKTKPKKDVSKLTAAQRADMVRIERAKFQQAKPMFAAVLGMMKQTVSITLPGKLERRSNFTSSPTGALGLNFEGAKLIKALEQLVTDDAWLEKNGFDMQSAPELDAEVAGLLFGEKAPVKAVVSEASEPLFDYAAEVSAALKGNEALQKQLGASIAPPSAGGALKSIQVVGVRLTSSVDKKLDLRPFNEDAGYTFAVLAELPGSVLDITDKSTLNTVIASDGSNLINGDSDWDRRLSFPKLSQDKASVLFDVRMKRPGPAVKSIREVSGTLQYRVAGATKEVDLGFKSLDVGSTGTELGASIEEIKPSWEKGAQRMELKLRLNKTDLKAAFLVVDGHRAEIKNSGYSSFDNATTFTLNHKGVFPKSGNIVVEIHDQLKTFDTPFKLENITLIGTPISGE
jgi:hypothetical protein